MRRRNKNKIIIFGLIGLLFLLVVGYAAFQTKLEIKGTSNISSEWRIEITGVSVANKNGLAENVNFEHTKTMASMEANLYEKGDYVEYNVEVSNLGTLNATIDNIANNIKSTNQAVKISFSGYTKGQLLKAKEKQTIKVKIEYDSNYDGEVPEGPAEIEIQPEYVQQSPGSTEPTPDKYLVSYDCKTNGGIDCSNYNEYLTEGSTISLGHTTTYKGYKFIGWNTDKTANSGLESLTMGTNDVTLYAIFTPKKPPIIDNVSTSSTTNSITVAVSANDDDSRIVKYEYSIDGVNYFSRESNTYTFDGLTQNKTYTVYVKVTNEDDLSSSTTKDGVTLALEKPMFTQTKDTEVTINYPEGCGGKLTCTYEYNDKTSVTVTSNSINVPIDQAGNIVTKVTDGTNSTSSNHTVLYNDLYVSSMGNDSTGYGTKTKPYATTGKAYTMATNTASIKVMNNITSNETTNLNQNKNITLTSYSTDNTVNSIIRGASQTSYVLNQTDGNLTLENITIDGNNVEATRALLVTSNTNSNIYIENGSTIKNGNNANTSTDASSTEISGGGVMSLGGTITLNGGEITNNKAVWGGGICALSSKGGKLIFKDGKVSNNEAYFGGGINAGNLEMSGGEVSNNKSTDAGGGIVMGTNDSFMTGGTVLNNSSRISGGGIYITGGSFTLSNNALIDGNSANSGGGINVNNNATLNIEGGTISNNSASGHGGGVYSYSSTTININGGIITKNISDIQAGGIFCQGIIEMNDGIISDNRALSEGGGIKVTDASNFTINGGKIINNTADDMAGGIMVYNKAIVTMNGGEISGNISAHGGGITVSAAKNLNHTATFILDGGVIKNNISSSSAGGIHVAGIGTYTYKSGTVCGNTPSNSYETASTCPA